MIFRLKFWLGRQWMHLWPLLVVGVLLLVVMQSGQNDNYQYHSSALGKAVFGSAQQIFGEPLSALANWTGAEGDQSLGLLSILVLIFIVAFIAGIIALLFGLTASDSRLSRRLAKQITSRTRPAYKVSVTSMVQRYADQFKRRANSPAPHNDYAQLLSYELHDLTPDFPLAEIALYDQGYRREAWRVRRVHHVQASIPLTIDLPTMMLIPKLLDSENSSINDLLGNSDAFVRLEGNFSDVFDLYVARGYELYALQILNPSVMLKLMRQAPEAWVELDGRSLTVLRMGLPTSLPELEKFEALSTTVAATLKPYIMQQLKRGGKTAQSYEKFPARIALRPLISDYLLYGAMGVLLLTAIAAIVSPLFTPLETVSRNLITGEALKTPTIWGDTLEAIALLAIVLIFLIMLTGEVEARSRHLRWQYNRRRALRIHTQELL